MFDYVDLKANHLRAYLGATTLEKSGITAILEADKRFDI